jgi:hypothetical protein
MLEIVPLLFQDFETDTKSGETLTSAAKEK